jgi:hypothetical protein
MATKASGTLRLFFPCFSFLGSPRMEHKALRMLGKHPTTEQHSQILSLLFLREGF